MTPHKMKTCQKIASLLCILGLMLIVIGFWTRNFWNFWTFFCCLYLGTSLMQPITFAFLKMESELFILLSAVINCVILIFNAMVIYLNFNLTSWSFVLPFLMIHHIMMIYVQSWIFGFHFDIKWTIKFYFVLFVAYTFSFVSKGLYPQWWANISHTEILSELNAIFIYLSWFFYDMVVLSGLIEIDCL
jgi:hypothetical protein